ncbi:MAG: 4Fe-4S dicluster domain-containing protein [Candidatus Asgardarchaeia archaeon]
MHRIGIFICHCGRNITSLEVHILDVDFKNSVFISAKTDIGKQILENTGLLLISTPESREPFVNELIQKCLGARNAFFKETQKEIASIDELKKLFSSRINCHNCMKACPIYFCKEYFFESPIFEYTSRKYELWADNRGVFSVSNGKILFHLGRLTHMATSCTDCGLYEQACPVNIPLLKLFKLVGYNVQLVFEYEPGRELEEPLPLTTFKEVELEKIVGRGEE